MAPVTFAPAGAMTPSADFLYIYIYIYIYIHMYIYIYIYFFFFAEKIRYDI